MPFWPQPTPSLSKGDGPPKTLPLSSKLALVFWYEVPLNSTKYLAKVLPKYCAGSPPNSSNLTLRVPSSPIITFCVGDCSGANDKGLVGAPID